MTRTIQAPGIELREIDKSDYGKEDYSLTSTTVFACGFASKGPNYVINWINTILNFIDTYGAPETTEEKYFYNVAAEVLTKGGIFLGARLPYNNQALSSYASTNFIIEEEPKYLSADDNPIGIFNELLKAIDPTIKKYIKITTGDGKTASYISPEQLEELRVSKTSLKKNTLKIVDITHSQYDSIYVNTVDETTGTIYRHSTECLGIIPVITTPLNAIFYLGLLSAETRFYPYEYKDDGDNVSKDPLAGHEVTECLSAFLPVKNWQLMDNIPISYLDDNYSTYIASNSIYENTVSKQALEYFPTISFANSRYLDRTYLKLIGIVVFKAIKDATTNETISFLPIEAFVGSLRKDDRDPVTKRSIFIDNVVNSKSEYINVFSNISELLDYNSFDIFFAANNIVTSLGLTKNMSSKEINYNVSILNALNIILDSAKDKNLYNIDIVCDAGISNIAQRKWQSSGNKDKEAILTLSDYLSSIQWKAIILKFTTFCSIMRKDCMFLADGLKTFGLENDTKIVRRSVPQNTIEKNIIPKLKFMTGVNSSYAAGYAVWFLAPDAFSGDLIWLPPSIKAAGIYIYTDIYYNKWDAPAGMARGKVKNVIDCAFSPSLPEAEKLYMQCWNYAVSYPIDGIVLEGQRTFLMKRTAFDRVNVRRLFLYLEKEVSRIAKYFKYEGNTEFLRNRFVDTIRPLFDSAVTKGGIREYYIKCDEENNTPQTIENNELRCAIAVKPVKTIEFIILNFVCTNLSAVVSEVVAEQN